MAGVAVVTGSSSGIGQAVVKALLREGFVVYGLSREVVNFEGAEEAYMHHCLDITQSSALEALSHKLPKELTLVVQCAGIGSFKPLEQFSVALVEKTISTNFTAAVVLTTLLLARIKASKGAFIYVASIEALRSMRHSAIYSATKSALRAFALSLYEEVRKEGVMVSVINPDMTDTPFFDDKRFAPSAKENHALFAEDIAAVVIQLLSQRPRVSTVEVTLRSQYFGIEKQ